jgi:transposase
VAAKIRLVEETLQPGMSASFVPRKHGLSPSLVFNWRQRMAEGGREAVRVDDAAIRVARVRQLEQRFASSSERLARDPAMRAVVGREGLNPSAASTSKMGRFEPSGW